MPTALSPGAADDLLLRVTPPRIPRHLVARPRLFLAEEKLRDAPVLLLQSPAGFGKTALLAQWRREHLAQGAVVAWMSAAAQDDPAHLLTGLTLSLRMAAGRPTFGHVFLGGALPPGLEGVTAWLAELAQTALNVVLVVDDADRLPPASREALGYLLHNAPPNLRAIVATRPHADLGLADLVAHGDCVVLGTERLRFRLDETLELVQGRLGTRIDTDTAARLQELTEGWSLGLQLALGAVSAAADPRAEVAAMAGQGGRLGDDVAALLIGRLDADDAQLLTDLAVADELHPELSRALAGDAAPARLARLVRDTPLFAVSQGDAGRAQPGPGGRQNMASGCGCTRWCVTCCAAASRSGRPPRSPPCMRGRPAGSPAAAGSTRRRATRWPPASPSAPTRGPSAACTNR